LKGDTVFSPFAGIGSELFVAIQNQRKGVGIELKESYWNIACENLCMAKSIGKLDYGNNGEVIKPRITKGNYGNHKLSNFSDKNKEVSGNSSQA
jgi:DNA modification methylase